MAEKKAIGEAHICLFSMSEITYIYIRNICAFFEDRDEVEYPI